MSYFLRMKIQILYSFQTTLVHVYLPPLLLKSKTRLIIIITQISAVVDPDFMKKKTSLVSLSHTHKKEVRFQILKQNPFNI
jgi:hypothetical protein